MKQELLSKLREFTANIKQFQKMTVSGLVPDPQKNQYYQLCQDNKDLIDQIHSLFSSCYSSKQNDIGVYKLRKQFQSLLQNYKLELKRQEELEEKEIRELRKTYEKFRDSVRSARVKHESMSESERGVQIQMVEINQETYHYQRMIEIKQKEINTIKQRMHDALKVQQQMQFMVNEQGERLDLAEGNLEDANKHVHDANQYLIDAKEQHMISKKRQACIFAIILTVILAAVIFIAVKYG